MNLKEAFRYQNKLDTYFQSITSHLGYQQNITTIKQEHMRKKSNPDAIDETIDITKDRKLDYPVNTLIDFAVQIIREKEIVSEAIDYTKRYSNVQIDSAISLNKKKQELSKLFSQMANIKTQDVIKQGQDYKFNQEGNQVTYNYEVNVVSTIDFDRNKVKALSKIMINESDDISTRIDKFMIESEVRFTPTYDINDTFEDALEKFESTVKE